MITDISIDGTRFSAEEHPFIIAEIGTAHGGSLAKAKELVCAAAESGADAAKFQIVYADEILHRETGEVALPTGSVKLYDRFKDLELSRDFYMEVAEFCTKKGVMFSASTFGKKSTADLAAIHAPFTKIASPELNYDDLLRDVSALNVPMIISSGVSRLADIEHALEVVRSANTNIEVAVLHCVTAYPAPETDYNLSVLPSLSTLFACALGVSDHSLDPVLVPVLATSLGASVIEKHICLSKKDGGLDDPVALPPEQFLEMTQTVNKHAGKKLQTVIAELVQAGYARDIIDAVIGKGRKTLSPAEADNYTRTNRSLHYTKAFPKGHCLAKDDIAVLRTEKKLSVGAPPQDYRLFIGSILQHDVSDGQGAVLADIIQKEVR